MCVCVSVCIGVCLFVCTFYFYSHGFSFMLPRPFSFTLKDIYAACSQLALLLKLAFALFCLFVSFVCFFFVFVPPLRRLCRIGV